MANQFSDEQKRQLAVILGLMAQGSQGRQYLSALQPVFQILEQNKQRRDVKRAERGAILGQLGQIGGQVGGLYLASKLIGGGAAAGAGAGAGASAGLGAGAGAAGLQLLGASGAPAVATPNLISANLVGGAGTGAGTSTLASAAGYALPVAAVIAGLSNIWESGGKDILRGRGDRSDWANFGINGLLGGAPNIALRLLGKRSVGAMMTSGKSEAQQIRDDFRGQLKANNIADSDYNVRLADGSKFNIGLDGGARLTNSDGKTQRAYYDVDSSNPLQQYAVSQIDPLVRSQFGKDIADKKYLPSQLTGMIVNAVTSNAKTKEEVLANIKSVLGEKLDGLKNPLAAQSAPAPTPTPTPTTPPPAAKPATAGQGFGPKPLETQNASFLGPVSETNWEKVVGPENLKKTLPMQSTDDLLKQLQGVVGTGVGAPPPSSNVAQKPLLTPTPVGQQPQPLQTLEQNFAPNQATSPQMRGLMGLRSLSQITGQPLEDILARLGQRVTPL